MSSERKKGYKCLHQYSLLKPYQNEKMLSGANPMDQTPFPRHKKRENIFFLNVI